MDIKNTLDYKHEYYTSHNVSGNNRYKYEEDGILTKCLPKILFKGNSLLVTFLQLIDLRLIMMFKYIDKVKRFKFITWY
jgi:hypothetical protein